MDLHTFSNGKTSGITQPSILGQEEVIRKAYKKAGLDPKDTAYVECHGTGTGVGDPMEVEALSNFFPRDRPTPLLLGAVSTINVFVLYNLAKSVCKEQNEPRSQRSGKWNFSSYQSCASLGTQEDPGNDRSRKTQPKA